MGVAELAPAPVEPRAGTLRARLRVSTWTLLVAASSILLVGGAAAFGAGWLASGRTESRGYSVSPPLLGVQVRVVSGDVVVIGGARGAVVVRRRDRSTFGHGPVEWRSRSGGYLTIASACPRLVVGACGASYRISVPDNVPVSVRADHGSIRLDGFRGSASLVTGRGSISVDAFCGHALRAVSSSGDLSAVASCAPEQVELRSTSGSIHASVPTGHYRIDASAGAAPPVVRGLISDPNAPWTIQALSTSGGVVVESS
jgi:hypothetical protein